MDHFRPLCSLMDRGEAAEKRQKQDNHGGPSNSKEKKKRQEWNATIHCPHITKPGEVCPRSGKKCE